MRWVGEVTKRSRRGGGGGGGGEGGMGEERARLMTSGREEHTYEYSLLK